MPLSQRKPKAITVRFVCRARWQVRNEDGELVEEYFFRRGNRLSGVPTSFVHDDGHELVEVFDLMLASGVVVHGVPWWSVRIVEE